MFSSVQLLSPVRLFVTPWTAARQASLSITNSWSLLELLSIELVMPSNHLILCHPLLLLPWIFPSIRVFSNESVLCIRWLKYWSFSFNISPSNEHPGLVSFRMGTGWISMQPLDCMEIQPVPILKETSPGCSLEGLMLKLKLQYFGHLMWRTDSLQKTLMLGKTEGRRRRGWQRMRWLDGCRGPAPADPGYSKERRRRRRSGNNCLIKC